jgi:hypothetical protein
MSNDGRSKAAVFQGGPICYTKLSEYFRESIVSYTKLKLPSHYLSIFFDKHFRLPQIYEEFYHTINNSDHEKDLRWWSNTHGVNMAMNWPQFEVSRDQT